MPTNMSITVSNERNSKQKVCHLTKSNFLPWVMDSFFTKYIKLKVPRCRPLKKSYVTHFPPLRYEAIWCSTIGYIQCTLNLVTVLVSLKMSLNCILSLNILIFCSNGLLQKKMAVCLTVSDTPPKRTLTVACL